MQEEYTSANVIVKTENPVCQADKLFDPSNWLEERQAVVSILRGRIFVNDGFPVDLLAGKVAARDGILLFNAEKAQGSCVVEYRFTHNGTKPAWLNTDSQGRPRSAMTCFRAWLHNEGRDAAYLCDSPRTAFRIMEAWWQAEGRLPDIAWTGCRGQQAVHVPDWLRGRHLLLVGSASLVNSGKPVECRGSAWLRADADSLPDNLYLICRQLEDMANDPGNYGDTVELQMADNKRSGKRGRLAALCLPRNTKWTKLREVQEKCLPAGGVPQAISHVPKLRPVKKGCSAAAGQRVVSA